MQNQLHVTATDNSHHQADHKKSNCLQLHWWLVISNITNVVFYNIYDMQYMQHHTVYENCIFVQFMKFKITAEVC